MPGALMARIIIVVHKSRCKIDVMGENRLKSALYALLR